MSAGIGIIVTAILGRALGASGFGLYTLVLSFGAILHVLSDGGLYVTLAREITKNPMREQGIFSTILGLRIISLVVVFVFGWIVILGIPGYRWASGLYWLAAVGFFAQSLSQLLVGAFQKYGVMWKVAAGDISGRIVQLVVVAVVFLVVRTGTQTQALGMTMVAFSAGALVAYVIHATLVPRLLAWKVRFVPRDWKPFIQKSWPIGLMLIVNAVYFRIDILMLSWFRSTAEVGWYGAAYKAIESGLFIPAAFGGLLLPRIAEARSAARKGELLTQGVFSMMVLGVLAFVVLLVGALPLITLFVGPAFAPAGNLLAVLSVALAIMFLGNVFGFALVAEEQQKQLLVLYSVLAIGNIAGNALFIPHFGAVAAAWTTVATEAVACSVAAMLTVKHIAYHVHWKDAAGVVVAAALAAAVLFVAQHLVSIIIAVGLTCAVYAGLLWALGLLRKQRVAALL